MGPARAYAVGLLTFTLGAIQVGTAILTLLSRPALLYATALAAGTLTAGLLLFLAARYVAQRRIRGWRLAVVGFAGVVLVHFGPLFAGDRTAVHVGSVLAALVLMVYLFIHEDAFGDRHERQLTEDTNTHEFIR